MVAFFSFKSSFVCAPIGSSGHKKTLESRTQLGEAGYSVGQALQTFLARLSLDGGGPSVLCLV